MSQTTTRSLPDQVEAEPRRLAAETLVSLSRMVSLLVPRALGYESEGERRREVSCAFGTWSSDEYAEFEANSADFEKIDDELWR